jgi:DNA-binding transcriptional ArsR family regulator
MSSRQLNRQLAHAAPLFAALGDDVRLYLLARLCAGGPLSISRLAEGVEVTRQAVTKHLHVLEQAGVIVGARHGRERLWQLQPAALAEARQALDVIGSQWESALNRLKAFVESGDRASR